MFGRRQADIIPTPETASGKAVLEINKFAELAVIGLATMFFGTLWYGVNDSSQKLAKIEGKLDDLPTKQEFVVMNQKISLLEQQATTGAAERVRLREEARELEIRLRAIEVRR